MGGFGFRVLVIGLGVWGCSFLSGEEGGQGFLNGLVVCFSGPGFGFRVGMMPLILTVLDGDYRTPLILTVLNGDCTLVPPKP